MGDWKQGVRRLLYPAYESRMVRALPAELPDNGLAGGDPTARGPAILWSLVALLIWFGAWYLSKRRLHGWWRVAPYVVLIPFFTMALYASFENITRLLPGAY